VYYQNEVREKTVSTLEELLNLINEYSYKKLYFRGENKDHGETACLPNIFRENINNGVFFTVDRDINWLIEIFEYLGIGIPYRPRNDDSTKEVILSALLNTSPSCWSYWGEDKLEAILQHYSSDFDFLKCLGLLKTNLDFFKTSFISRFLDITSDITVALHFACSRYTFKNENNETEKIQDGYIFVFDLNGIENSKHLKLVSYPSYTYFYKNEDDYHFQPFDRITHQRGSFLAPKIDKNRLIDYCVFKKEIKDHISEKITLKSEVKQELFKIFGSEKGFDYYFPKIPLLTPKNKEIAEVYNNIEGITILE
jgi:hypothetical protein